jgi:hypothetical protein
MLYPARVRWQKRLKKLIEKIDSRVLGLFYFVRRIDEVTIYAWKPTENRGKQKEFSRYKHTRTPYAAICG